MMLSLGMKNEVSSQTQGTMSFTTNIVCPNGNWTTKHVAAIWITDSLNNFVKTRLVNALFSKGNWDHLASWTAKSGSSLVDAVSGATLANYLTPLTTSWNATDLSGNVVPDGTYKVWVEFAWTSSGNGVDTVFSVPFRKATSTVNYNPTTNNSHVRSIVLDWVPSLTSLEYTALKLSDIVVYPSPTSNIINIDFKQFVNGCIISVYSLAGKQVYSERTDKSIIGTKTIHLGAFADGEYVIQIAENDQKFVYKYKVILKK